MAVVSPSKRFEVSITGTHGIKIPEQVALPFIEAGYDRVLFHAFFNDRSIRFHGALKKYGGVYMVSFGKGYQQELGVDRNDSFELQLEVDRSKYGVEVPEEFSAVFESDPEAAAIFEGFSDGKKRTLIYHVLRFKSMQSRIDKSLIISENIKMGITNPKDLIKDHRRN